MDTNQGGFLIPETAYINERKDGLFFACLDWLGCRIIELGERIQRVCYYKKEIHPRASLLKMMEEMRVIKHD